MNISLSVDLLSINTITYMSKTQEIFFLSSLGFWICFIGLNNRHLGWTIWSLSSPVCNIDPYFFSDIHTSYAHTLRLIMQFLRFRFHRFSPVCSHGMGFIVADYLSSVEVTDVGIATLLKFVYDENTLSYPISPLYGCNSWLRLGVILLYILGLIRHELFDSDLERSSSPHLYFTDSLTVHAGTWSLIFHRFLSHRICIAFLLLSRHLKLSRSTCLFFIIHERFCYIISVMQ